jgi:hypothetical protein
MYRYILDGHKVVQCDDLMKWAMWMETENRCVKHTYFNKQGEVGIVVCTDFLGIDHNFANWGAIKSKPILFETMIISNEGLSDEQDRCSTWEEAELMHEEMVSKMAERLKGEWTKEEVTEVHGHPNFIMV